MHECLLCKRNMKTAITIFGSGCIKNVYKILDLKIPKSVKDKEQYLYKSIMKKLNIKSLNTNQKVWLADRYLTYQYLDKLKYGDYAEVKGELNEKKILIFNYYWYCFILEYLYFYTNKIWMANMDNTQNKDICAFFNRS